MKSKIHNFLNGKNNNSCKNKLTLLAALLLFGSFYLTAQTTYGLDAGDNYGNGTQVMVGQREYAWDVDTLNWDDVDSFYMQYNGQDQLVLLNRLAPNTSISGPWKNNLLSQRMYDANGNILLQVDSSSNPTVGDRYEFTYNNNLEVQKLHKLWNTSLANWANYYRYTTSYTASNKVNVYLTEGWHYVNQVWQNSQRSITTYNAQNLDSINTFQKWNTSSNQWMNYIRNSYEYDGNGNQTYGLREIYDTAFSVFKPEQKIEYTYDASNRVTSYIVSSWNPNTNLWKFYYRYTYTYNAQSLLNKTITEYWNTSMLQWDSTGLYTTTYDANNRPMEELYETRDNNTWRNQGRNTYTRNANGYRTRYLWEFWNTNTLAWRNYGAIDYWYANRITPINGITEQVEDKLHVYPNPTNSPVVFVNAESNLPYSVYDLTGRLVAQGKLQQGTNSIILDEAKGIYLLKAGNSTTKIVKQ